MFVVLIKKLCCVQITKMDKFSYIVIYNDNYYDLFILIYQILVVVTLFVCRFMAVIILEVCGSNRHFSVIDIIRFGV